MLGIFTTPDGAPRENLEIKLEKGNWYLVRWQKNFDCGGIYTVDRFQGKYLGEYHGQLAFYTRGWGNERSRHCKLIPKPFAVRYETERKEEQLKITADMDKGSVLKPCVSCGHAGWLKRTKDGNYLAVCSNKSCQQHVSDHYKNHNRGNVVRWWNDALPMSYGQCESNPNPFGLMDR